MFTYTIPRVALVTGGSQGIGRATALRLAQMGAKVAINDRPGVLQAYDLVEEIKKSPGEAAAFPADISQPDQVSKLIDSVVSTYGRLDILVNNAGILRDSLLLRMTDAQWDEVQNVNLRGAFLCTRAALRPMLKGKWGRIINISSVVAMIGNAGQANYAASKAGLIGFTKAVAREVAPRAITVNAVAPGYINTSLTSTLKPESKAWIIKQIPLGNFGSPEDVANAVAFLASEEASYITGHVLSVDGGLAMG